MTDIESVSQVTTEQADACAQVLKQMENFAQQAQDATRTMEESTDYASKLRRLSDDLRQMIDAMRSERRGDSRHAVTEPHMFKVTDIDGNSCECTVLDVSVSGMRMHSDTGFTLREGEAVVLSAPKPPFSKLFPRTDAQVVWVDGKLMGVTYMTRISAGAVEQVVREANIKA